MNLSIERLIPADHPSLSGHFPGNPIVSGVLILDEVVSALLELNGDYRLHGIPLVKFLAPLRPDETFTIALDLRRGEPARFRCTLADGRLVAQGQLDVGPESPRDP